LVPLLSSFLDVVNAYVDHLTVTLFGFHCYCSV
jgi:hypothetical protein